MKEIYVKGFLVRELSGLHFLRFLLAISILIVHFPHFFFPFAGTLSDRSTFPFYPYIDLIYAYGGFAVEIFWMVSGFIFYIFYLDKIRDRDISFIMFLGLRLSKLYPLHFITLLSVAYLQVQYFGVHGKTFIYENNDFIHFILNLFTINFWNAKFGLSFNGPFWSVSVEMFVYLVFFMFARIGLLNSRNNLICIAIVFFMFYSLGILSPFYECLLYFFCGALLASEYKIFSKRIIFSFMFFCLIFLTFRYYNPSYKNYYELKRVIDALIKINVSILFVVLFIKVFRDVTYKVRRVFIFLGDITYSIYMMHITLQIILIMIFYKNGASFFNTEIFFIFYIVISLMLGLLSYKLVEAPMQRIFRSFMKIEGSSN
jgi:peptidoglycan/LPS O-acetylase OafA/YrhL